jgi:hypothetical protein
MNIAQIEENVQNLLKSFSQETFVYDLLDAYGKPKASIKRLQNGTYNLSKIPGEIIWKKNLYFKDVREKDLHITIDQIRRNEQALKHNPRFIIVTDYKTLLAVDTKTTDTLDIPIKDLAKYFDFFLPWAGLEKAKNRNENPADIKAAERMAKLYDELRKDNPGMDHAALHSLNVFLSRLLFCFFAEDTEIFEKGSFTDSISSHTLEDGSDLNSYLDRLFDALNIQDRSSYPKYIQDFPYVNGGLFGAKHKAPKFSRRSRKMIIECGELDWSAINPDIFGSMIQAVVHPDKRGDMGMHYTSVTNIMKVIEPLFLNEIQEEFEENKDNSKKLKALLQRLERIKIFDPACGSGNFLIIAYKELRKLEMLILEELIQLHAQQPLFSGIRLSQFYGIELDDFAHEISILSLWLAEHQMNVAFKKTFGQSRPSLPLKEGGHIVCGNATKLDWKEVCPKDEDAEIYLLGNPPYLGARNQGKEQKNDMRYVFNGREEYKDSDYVSCWFLKGSDYIKENNSKFAFVATNSICQGEHVTNLWPYIFDKGLEIGFAYQSFKWTNNAQNNAGVSCIIVGVRNRLSKKKKLFSNSSYREVENINAYLTAAGNVFVHSASTSISKLPKMVMGNMPRDGGHLILSVEEKEECLNKYPETKSVLRRLFGAQEYLQGKERWCLWITDDLLSTVKEIDLIKSRIEAVYDFRISSKAKTTQGYSNIPHKFAQRSHKEGNSIIVPRHSSERREYIPFGFLDSNSIIIDSAQAIYGAESYIFGVISSKIHMVWVKAVAGRLKTDYRYSSAICYNTFPIPSLTDKQKENIKTNVFNVLGERESHCEKTIAALYDPDKMPKGLREAHRNLDLAVEHCYRSKLFESDEERLEFLFKLYAEMVQNEREGKIHA